MKTKSFLIFITILFYSLTTKAEKWGSKVDFIPKKITEISLKNLDNKIEGKITNSVILNEYLLYSLTNAKEVGFKVNFEESFVLVIYNGLNYGQINPLGASYFPRAGFLKVGYSVLEKKEYQPYVLLLVNKTGFKTLKVLPTKKHFKAGERNNF